MVGIRARREPLFVARPQCSYSRPKNPPSPPSTIIHTTLKPPPQLLPALLLTLLTSLPIRAQQPRTTILLDPAHGGPDTGAHLADNTLEKDLTLAFANRLRALLATNGFTIQSTRDADPTVPFSTDQRAEIANHLRPTACLILHASSTGSGVHIVTSPLAPPDADLTPTHLTPWNTAQSASIPQSLSLANDLAVAFIHAKIPFTLSRASIPPLDNLTCPAAALEIAPLPHANADPTSPADTAYQQRLAQTISSALTSWRKQTVAAAAGAAR